jgi:hypothetical protein
MGQAKLSCLLCHRGDFSWSNWSALANLMQSPIGLYSGIRVGSESTDEPVRQSPPCKGLLLYVDLRPRFRPIQNENLQMSALRVK